MQKYKYDIQLIENWNDSFDGNESIYASTFQNDINNGAISIPLINVELGQKKLISRELWNNLDLAKKFHLNSELFLC